MNQLSAGRALPVVVYLALVCAACIPIWSVDRFLVQDGTPHVYNAWLMNAMVDGDFPAATGHVKYNSITVPNSTGHWFLTILLRVVSPFTATKLMLCGIFAAFVAAVGWLRLQTGGVEGLKTSLLFGAVIGFNWLWFIGFFNFSIGVVGFVFTVGLYWRWRKELNVARAVVLALLVTFVYLSHAVSFAMLAGSLLFLAVLGSDVQYRRRNTALTSLSMVPAVILLLIFRSISASGDPLAPNWRSLTDPLTAGSIVRQLLSADPFVIISRKGLPFVSGESSYYLLLAPALWISIAILILIAATIRTRPRSWIMERERFPFVLLFFGGVAGALLGPDDFGLTHGSIFRERVLLCSLVFLVPWLYDGGTFAWRRAANIALLIVVAFQMLALAEYARHSESAAAEHLSAGTVLSDGDSIASVSVLEGPARFHSTPESMMNPLNGIGKNIKVWDNYELGHYLFPLTAREADDRKFIHDLATAIAFESDNPSDPEPFEHRLARLDSILSAGHTRITKLVVWGRDERLDAMLGRWFDLRPLYENGRVRVLKHK